MFIFAPTSVLRAEKTQQTMFVADFSWSFTSRNIESRGLTTTFAAYCYENTLEKWYHYCFLAQWPDEIEQHRRV